MSEIPKYIQDKHTLIWYRANGEYRWPQEGDVFYEENCNKPYVRRCFVNDFPQKRVILTECTPQPDRGMIWGHHRKTDTWVVLSNEIRVPDEGEFYPQLINGKWYVYRSQGSVTARKRILIPQDDYAGHLVFQKSQWQGPDKLLLPPQTAEEYDATQILNNIDIPTLPDMVDFKNNRILDFKLSTIQIDEHIEQALIEGHSMALCSYDSGKLQLTRIPSKDVLKQNANQQENSTMAHIINEVTQEIYINGTEASQLTDSKLIELIANSEKEVVALAEMNTQSKAIKARQKELADNIDAVSKILDERYEAKKAKK